MLEHEKRIAEIIKQAMVDNDFGKIRITLGPVSMTVRPTRFYADKEKPEIYGIQVRGAGLIHHNLNGLACRIYELACNYDIRDIISALPEHIELCGSSKKYDRKWVPEKKGFMKGVNTEKALNAVSVNVAPQKQLARKEKALKDFVREIPITIEYGCHTIELKPDSRNKIYGGYTFYATEEDGEGIKIIIV